MENAFLSPDDVLDFLGKNITSWAGLKDYARHELKKLGAVDEDGRGRSEISLVSEGEGIKAISLMDLHNGATYLDLAKEPYPQEATGLLALQPLLPLSRAREVGRVIMAFGNALKDAALHSEERRPDIFETFYQSVATIKKLVPTTTGKVLREGYLDDILLPIRPENKLAMERYIALAVGEETSTPLAGFDAPTPRQ